jgi:hypothetical protein
LLRIRIAFDLARPPKKSEELLFFFPEQIQKIPRSNRIRALAGISFESPSQISASPRSQPVTACSIPQKPEFFADTSRHHPSIFILPSDFANMEASVARFDLDLEALNEKIRAATCASTTTKDAPATPSFNIFQVTNIKCMKIRGL